MNAAQTKPLTLDTLFDLVAPIAIMHRADLTYEEKAKKAVRRLRKHRDDPTVIEYLGRAEKLVFWDDYIEHMHPGGGLHNILDVYNSLFKEIVEFHRPDWKPFYDGYGAKGYKDGHGHKVFAGDGVAEFPWFETSKLLVERIEEHDEQEA